MLDKSATGLFVLIYLTEERKMQVQRSTLQCRTLRLRR